MERMAKHCRTQLKTSGILKKFATALFIHAGPLVYEFLQQNMPEALLCPYGGFKELFIWITLFLIREAFAVMTQHCILNSTTHPSIVSIGEDATRIHVCMIIW